MALVCRLLRVLVKRMHTTLAVAQRIVRFLLSTFRHIRSWRGSWRELWNVAETLLRSPSLEVEPRVDGSIRRTVEEDEFGGGASNSGKIQTLSSNLEIDDKEEDVMYSSHCLIRNGKYSESISLLSTIMETSEDDDTETEVHEKCP